MTDFSCRGFVRLPLVVLTTSFVACADAGTTAPLGEAVGQGPLSRGSLPGVTIATQEPELRVLKVCALGLAEAGESATITAESEPVGLLPRREFVLPDLRYPESHCAEAYRLPGDAAPVEVTVHIATAGKQPHWKRSVQLPESPDIVDYRVREFHHSGYSRDARAKTGGAIGSVVTFDFLPGAIVYENSYHWSLHLVRGGGTDRIDLRDNQLRHDPSWSPDGTRLAFVSAEPFESGDLDIYIGRPFPYSRERLLRFRGTDRHPAWSPDGARIAFTHMYVDGSSDIFMYDLRDGTLTALTRGPTRNVDPSWSPDGNLLAFVSDRDGNEDIYLYSRPAFAKRRTHSVDEQ